MFWNQGVFLYVVRVAAFSLIIAHFFQVPAWLSGILGAGFALALGLVGRLWR